MNKETYDDLFNQFNDSLKRIHESIFFHGQNEGVKQVNKEHENLSILKEQFKKEVDDNKDQVIEDLRLKLAFLQTLNLTH